MKGNRAMFTALVIIGLLVLYVGGFVLARMTGAITYKMLSTVDEQGRIEYEVVSAPGWLRIVYKILIDYDIERTKDEVPPEPGQ